MGTGKRQTGDGSTSRRETNKPGTTIPGFALDLNHPVCAALLAITQNADALAAVDTFRRGGIRFCVLAGFLNQPDGGVFAVAATAASGLPAAVIAANARMAELGATSTTWLVAADAETTSAIRTVLAESENRSR